MATIDKFGSFTSCTVDDDNEQSAPATKTITIEEDATEDPAACVEAEIDYEKTDDGILICLKNNNATPLLIIFDDPDYADVTIAPEQTEKVPFKHPLYWVYQCQ